MPTLRIPFSEMKAEFERILLQLGFSQQKASLCATLFAANSRDGVYSHGLNRFPVFVNYVKEGLINPLAEPVPEKQSGSIEHWNGNSGAGPYNASMAMKKAIGLAKENGLGLVTLKNTNHWMRGGSYGWQAVEEGCISICTTNTIANMPPWGGKSPALGNNPLVIAVPRTEGHVVLDMAMSQYSYGALHDYHKNGKNLPVPGGYDHEGKLTDDPKQIYKSQRVLPIGFWKGSGLSMVLDILLTALGGGDSVPVISSREKETGISQLFIAIYQKDLHESLTREIIRYAKESSPATGDEKIYYPGEKTLKTREDNLLHGIPVHEDIWANVKAI